MRNVLIIAAALVVLGLNVSHAAEPSKQAFNREISDAAKRTMDARGGLDVSSLRESSCGELVSADPDAKNAAFVACMMYVLGAVDMIQEWKSIDPAHAPAAYPETFERVT
jgi:hypothetical protein